MADLTSFKTILPPLPATFSQSIKGLKDAPAQEGSRRSLSAHFQVLTPNAWSKYPQNWHDSK
jgi:hypothetical protein